MNLPAEGKKKRSLNLLELWLSSDTLQPSLKTNELRRSKRQDRDLEKKDSPNKELKTKSDPKPPNASRASLTCGLGVRVLGAITRQTKS